MKESIILLCTVIGWWLFWDKFLFRGRLGCLFLDGWRTRLGWHKKQKPATEENGKTTEAEQILPHELVPQVRYKLTAKPAQQDVTPSSNTDTSFEKNIHQEDTERTNSQHWNFASPKKEKDAAADLSEKESRYLNEAPLLEYMQQSRKRVTQLLDDMIDTEDSYLDPGPEESFDVENFDMNHYT